MTIYACGAHLYQQLPEIDNLQLPLPTLLSSSSSLIAASASQLVFRDDTGALQTSGHPLSPDVDLQLEEIDVWLGHDQFLAALRKDGQIQSFEDGRKTEERYALASMNGKGEILVVAAADPTSALLYLALSALFSPSPSSPPVVFSLPSSSASTERITSLSTGGASHFLLLSSPSTSLYSLGDNRYGQCGPSLSPVHSSSQPTTTLSRLETFDGLYPLAPLPCGASHSAVRTKDGSLYVFGSGKEGQLGLGEGVGGGGEPEVVDFDEATEDVDGYEAEEGERVVQVACGSAHTVVLTEKGEVWVAGANHDGQLGLGDFLPRPSFVRHAPISAILASSTPPRRITRILCTRWTTYFEVT